MLTDTDNELQLALRVRHGDATAMRQMYSAYIRYLTAVCSRYIVNSEDVKDVLQDSFMKIFSGIGSFEYHGKGSLKAWLARITVNEALKFLRKNNRIEFVDISEHEHTMADEEPDIDKLPSSVLFGLIRELPDGYRAVFNLYAVENRSHKEIAGLLDIKESTSASQLHRAKALLAAKIQQYNNQHS